VYTLTIYKTKRDIESLDRYFRQPSSVTPGNTRADDIIAATATIAPVSGANDTVYFNDRGLQATGLTLCSLRVGGSRATRATRRRGGSAAEMQDGYYYWLE
jgi:hypothetical protein